jgi:hypothetical protein
MGGSMGNTEIGGDAIGYSNMQIADDAFEPPSIVGF